MKKKKVFKRSLSAVLALIMAVGAAAVPADRLNVAASSSITEKQDKIKELEERNNQIDNQISNLDGQISDSQKEQGLWLDKINTVKELMDNYNNLLYLKEQDISAKQADIAALDLQIAAKEKEIDETDAKIKALNEDNEENLDRFGKTLRALYMTENSDIFSVLAESSDIYDLLVRTKIMVNVTAQNNQLMEELKASIENTEKLKKQQENDAAQLESYKVKLNSDMTELQSAKDDLLNKQAEAKKLNTEYQQKYNEYSGKIDNFEAKQKQLMEEKQLNKAEIEDYEKQIQREIQQAQQSSSQVYQQGEWMWPVDTQFHMITTYFGYDDWRQGHHSGIDIGNAGINGTNIYASKAGTVITAKDTYIDGYSYGKYVVIDHGDGYSTLYGHCSAIYVTVGQVVNKGDVVAAVGSTGWSTGPHLHFEVRVNGIAQDPFNYVKKYW